jgi:hypothetical protein
MYLIISPLSEYHREFSVLGYIVKGHWSRASGDAITRSSTRSELGDAGANAIDTLSLHNPIHLTRARHDCSRTNNHHETKDLRTIFATAPHPGARFAPGAGTQATRPRTFTGRHRTFTVVLLPFRCCGNKGRRAESCVSRSLENESRNQMSSRSVHARGVNLA